MALQQSAKQSSILDFFKRKNSLTQASGTPAASNEKLPPKLVKETINTNNKRPLEGDECKKPESLIVDVSFIKDGLLDICLDLPTDETTEEVVEENKENNNNLPNSNFIFSTFRSIIRSVISDEHYANLFNENDWNIVQDFTCLPGMPTGTLFKTAVKIISF